MTASGIKPFHLAQFLVHGPTYHSIAMWRHPKTDQQNYDWRRPELYQHIAQVCERGCFDMVFFADLNYVSDTYTGSMAPALRNATQAPEHDPIPLLSYTAAATKRIGVAATFSISYSHPFHVARLFGSLDHLTGGRAGWNVVTSINHNLDNNYGAERLPSDQRYERAHEFIQACRALWHSWDEDAVVMDQANAIFADPEKVHRVDFHGEYYRSRGPLNVTRSPQNGPAILQAGTSPQGRDFAARYADGIFAIQPRPEDARDYLRSIKERMQELGRDPRSCKILFGAQPIIGRDKADARAKQQQHNDLVQLEGGKAILSGHLDFDLSRIPDDAIMLERPEPELKRHRTRYRDSDGRPMTMAEVAKRHGQSVGLPQIVGTAKSIADQLEEFMAIAGGDGFMLSPIYCPGAIEEFVEDVVPILQRRGSIRTEYTSRTLKGHLTEFD
jgi:long-chain alkane monooxygenase